MAKGSLYDNPDAQQLGMSGFGATPSAAKLSSGILPERAKLAIPQIGAAPIYPGTSSSARLLLKIKLSLLDDNPFNSRSVYPTEAIEAMQVSLKEEGQLTPIEVYKNGDRYTILEGHTRTRAARAEWGAEAEVEAVVSVEKPSDLTLFLHSLVSNTERNSLTSVDLAHAYKRALDSKLFITNAELAEKLKISPTKLSMVLGFFKIPVELQSYCIEFSQTFTYQTFKAIREAATAKPDQVQEALAKIAAKNATYKQAITSLTTLMNATNRPKQQSSLVFHQKGDVVSASVRAGENGEKIIKIQGLTEDQFNDVLDAIKRTIN